MATSTAPSGRSRRRAPRRDQPSGGRPAREQRATWVVVFVGVLVTYVTFVVMLLPQGYDLWVVLGAATTTCLVAGQVTRTVTLISADRGMAGAVMPRSLLGRVVASWIRAVVADVPLRESGLQDGDSREP
ncbi:hypothetical protein [Nonomuraea sp. NPDC049784]|uniref:hypothetical protein n=1 Tax=Nonomuraea sp. NPDC049784 TaxID=3154361 RepID=UPI0033F30DE8